MPLKTPVRGVHVRGAAEKVRKLFPAVGSPRRPPPRRRVEAADPGPGPAEPRRYGSSPWGKTPEERRRLEARYEVVSLSNLRPWEGNPRISDSAVPRLKKLIAEHGFAGVIVATPDGTIRAGHTRFRAVTELGWGEIPVEWRDFPSKAAAEEYALADNKSAEWTAWDHGKLGELFRARSSVDLSALMNRTGFTPGQIRFVAEPGVSGAGSLRKQFGWDPFSVFNAMDGEWAARKKEWVALGIQSEVGRGPGSYKNMHIFAERKGQKSNLLQTSIFDPVLCETLYGWFCPPGGQVLDPFAGGSVRGIVAGIGGRRYWGSDLSRPQIAANTKQREDIWGRAGKAAAGWPKPVWVVGDAAREVPHAPAADFVFSCPPYGDLEVYSEDPADLSRMDADGFARTYRSIVGACAARLKPDRFTALVVGNYRGGPHGYLNDLVGLTTAAFEATGMALYNDAILLHPLGTLPLRVPRAFEVGRKLGKAHQNVLIYVKGNPRKAAEACGRLAAGREV